MKNFSIRPRDDGRKARRVLASRVVHRREWFDDEIAIDFPSLPSVVERMREAFADSHSDAGDRRSLFAVLHLSAREAFYGVTVPLDVPIR